MKHDSDETSNSSKAHAAIHTCPRSKLALMSPPSLQVPKLLMLKDVKAVQAYITDNERAWTIEGEFLKFNPKVVDNTVIPSERLIREALTYATEMERIV